MGEEYERPRLRTLDTGDSNKRLPRRATRFAPLLPPFRYTKCYRGLRRSGKPTCAVHPSRRQGTRKASAAAPQLETVDSPVPLERVPGESLPLRWPDFFSNDFCQWI